MNTDSLKIYEAEIISFCNEHKRIYFYGAGVYGETYYALWKSRDLQLDGVITTNGNGTFETLPAYKASDILPMLNSEDGIVLTVKEELQEEILKSQNFPCAILRFMETEYWVLSALVYRPIIYKVNEQYGCEKNIHDYAFKNILVVQLEVTFGDMIWSTAFIRELRQNYPDSYITMVMNCKYISLYEHCPYINQIYGYDCDSLNDQISEKMVDKVEAFCQIYFFNKQYDVVFLPRHLPLNSSDAWENVLVAQMSKARYRMAHGIGITKFNNFRLDMMKDIFTDISVHSCGEHEAKYDLSLLELVKGIVQNERMELWIGEEDRAFVRSVMMKQAVRTCFIAVALVGSKETRSWNPEKYNHVFRKFIDEYGDRVCFVLCGGNDSIQAAKIAMKGVESYCINLTDKTSLNQAAAVIERCDLYLGANTGLLHMASSFEKPVVEISASISNSPDYWGSSPTRTGAWKVPSIVLRPNKALDSCKYMCHQPYRHCIEQISEEQVVEAIEEMLDNL